MSNNHPNHPFISKKLQKYLANDYAGNEVDANREYIIHEVTVIGNRPTAKFSSNQSIDTVSQRMLLMDNGNSLNDIFGKMHVSMGEQTYREVKSDDECSSENDTARSSRSLRLLSMASPRNRSENIAKVFNDKNGISLGKSFDAYQTIEDAAVDVVQWKQRTDTVESEIEGAPEPKRETENRRTDGTIQNSIAIEMEKQLNEKSPTDEYGNRNCSIEIGKFMVEQRDDMKKSTDAEIPDALIDLILLSLLDDSIQIDQPPADNVSGDDGKRSQSDDESLELALQSISHMDSKINMHDLEIVIPSSRSTDDSSITPDIGLGEEFNSLAVFLCVKIVLKIH